MKLLEILTYQKTFLNLKKILEILMNNQEPFLNLKKMEQWILFGVKKYSCTSTIDIHLTHLKLLEIHLCVCVCEKKYFK